MSVGTADAHVQLGIVDPELIQRAGVPQVLHIEQVEARLTECPHHVRVRTAQLLLNLDVTDGVRLAQGDMGIDVHIAAPLLTRSLDLRRSRSRQPGGQQQDRRIVGQTRHRFLRESGSVVWGLQK